MANVAGTTDQTGRARAGLGLVVALIALIGALAIPGAAGADELAWKNCMTGDPELGPSGSGTCDLFPKSGLGGPTSIGMSPDGRSLYTAGYARLPGRGAPETYAMDRFDRDPATGELTYRGCFAGDTRLGGPDGCKLVPGAAPYNWGSGIQGVLHVTVSPDGKSVYAAGSDIVTRFDRSSTGALTYRGCVTSDPNAGPSGSACTRTGSGIGDVADLAVSPDGRSLYAVTPNTGDTSTDAAVARFDRNPSTGAIAYRNCISGNTFFGPSGIGVCKMIPSSSHEAIDSGLSPASLSISPDGKSLYTGSLRTCDEYDCYGSNAVARFDRDSSTGALTWQGCLTGDKRSGPKGSGACDAIPSATKGGDSSGLSGDALASSPDGKTLYAGGDSSVARLNRNAATGALTYKDCITGAKSSGPKGSGACDAIPTAATYGAASGLGTNALAMSPDGNTLYAGGGSDVARLRRDSATGVLEFRDCTTGATSAGPEGSGACATIPTATKDGYGSGLGPSVVALAPSAAALYTASCCYYSASLVSRFGFAPSTHIKKSRTHRHRAVFKFGADLSSTFECKLKGHHVKHKLRGWRSCGSGEVQQKGRQSYDGLKKGKKVFTVRATDAAGNTDPTPAKHRWNVR